MVPMSLLAGSNGDADIENRLAETRREEAGPDREGRADMYIPTAREMDGQWEPAVEPGSSARCGDDPGGGPGLGGGLPGKDVCVYRSLPHTVVQ